MARIKAVEGQTIYLGLSGENEATEIVFDISDLLAEYPQGYCELIVRKPYISQALPVPVVQTENEAVWTVTESDLITDGNGEAQLLFYCGNVCKRRNIYKTFIDRSLGNMSGDVSKPDGWINDIVKVGADARKSADEAEASAVRAEQAADRAEAGGGSGGGTGGKPGKDGLSAYELAVQQGFVGTLDEWLASLEGPQGPQGLPGEQGLPGDKGADGFSPIVTTSKSGKITTITITDKTGTKTVKILDGENGAGGSGSGTVESQSWKKLGSIDASLSTIFEYTTDASGEAFEASELILTGSGVAVHGGGYIALGFGAQWDLFRIDLPGDAKAPNLYEHAEIVEAGVVNGFIVADTFTRARCKSDPALTSDGKIFKRCKIMLGNITAENLEVYVR